MHQKIARTVADVWPPLVLWLANGDKVAVNRKRESPSNHSLPSPIHIPKSAIAALTFPSAPNNGHANPNGSNWQRGPAWKCSDKQKDLILKLVEEHQLDKANVEALAIERFNKGVRQLSKLEVSGLINELLDTYGGSNRPAERNSTAGKKIRPPKPASAVKALVEVRAQSWETSEVGWTEVDTVAHCGGDMGGDFIWTLTSLEIASGGTELRAVWNRGQQASFEGLESIWESQPFDLLGVDSDNGREFLNFHLYHWLKKHGVYQTRSRPYYKNDQAYVEQKNHPHTSASFSATSGSNTVSCSSSGAAGAICSA